MLAPDAGPIFADANQLESALLNLVVNARDAMRDGGRLTIETANVRLDETALADAERIAAGDYVMLGVSDTGAGIAPEFLDKVFEPFFTTKETGKGSGLGLSMVYGFVKQSGGHVRIYSEVGLGTTVKIYLPRLSASLTAPAPPPLAREEAPLVRARPGETILLVEDNDGVRRYGVGALEDLGYRVLAASDGAAALRLLDGAGRSHRSPVHRHGAARRDERPGGCRRGARPSSASPGSLHDRLCCRRGAQRHRGRGERRAPRQALYA